MIDFLIQIFIKFIEFLLRGLPLMSGSYVPDYSFITTIKGYFYMFDGFLPMTMIFSFIGVIATIEFSYLAFRTITRLVSAFRKG